MTSTSVRAVLALLLLMAGAVLPAAAQAAPSDTVVVFLVRHAEKLDDSRDPPLSETGQRRAAELARMLGDAGITQVWSTDYQRTRTTAGPTATARGLTVRLYDPADLPGFAAKLAAMPGRHLVVGHSNTTPALVRALGGNAGTLIGDAEYDRLYVLTRAGDRVITVQLRWGAAR